MQLFSPGLSSRRMKPRKSEIPSMFLLVCGLVLLLLGFWAQFQGNQTAQHVFMGLGGVLCLAGWLGVYVLQLAAKKNQEHGAGSASSRPINQYAFLGTMCMWLLLISGNLLVFVFPADSWVPTIIPSVFLAGFLLSFPLMFWRHRRIQAEAGQRR